MHSEEAKRIPELARRNAVITGGEGDLGQVIAKELEVAGYEVDAPGRARLDVRSAGSVADYFSRLRALDLLVINAGITRDVTLARMDAAAFEEVLEVNLSGAMRCARAGVKLMSEQGQGQGHVVFIGSFSSLSGPMGQANYAAAKAGLAGFALSVAKEYGERNVRANVVLPGFMETRMTEGLSKEVKEAALAKHVLGRFNTPECVGRFIRFLDQGMPHTSGQVFNLDSRIHRWT